MKIVLTGHVQTLVNVGNDKLPVTAALVMQSERVPSGLYANDGQRIHLSRDEVDDVRVGHPVWMFITNEAGLDLRKADVPIAPETDTQRATQLLREALDLVPRVNDDDPMAPALAAWCKKVREVLR